MDTLADEVLQLGALADAGVVKQGRADLGHHLLNIPGVKIYSVLNVKALLGAFLAGECPSMRLLVPSITTSD